MDDGPPVFSADSSCPQILWILSSPFRFRLSDSHTLRFTFPCDSANFQAPLTVPTPKVLLPQVWPLPRSLATTCGISFDFSSSRYLDVSVPGVPHIMLFVSHNVTWFFTMCVPTFGNLRIDGYLLLPAAYRSLSRPSSAPNAKAFSICSSSLELPFSISFPIYLPGSRFHTLELLCFILAVFWQNCFFTHSFHGKTFPISRFSFFPLLCLSCIPH